MERGWVSAVRRVALPYFDGGRDSTAFLGTDRMARAVWEIGCARQIGPGCVIELDRGVRTRKLLPAVSSCLVIGQAATVDVYPFSFINAVLLADSTVSSAVLCDYSELRCSKNTSRCYIGISWIEVYWFCAHSGE